MGEKIEFQPLTREDRVTVLLYRAGIVLSTAIICTAALLAVLPSVNGDAPRIDLFGDMLVYGLYASVGMSVLFIHLYIGKFKKYLRNLYFAALICLIIVFSIGGGSPSRMYLHQPYALLLLLPLSGCLGFITAKEAFCFRLFEGYFLAIMMPMLLLLAASGLLGAGGASTALALVAIMLAVFTLRKVFMPLAYDIGDKTAYR
jgi:uncharacterized integral membrane protein